MKKTKDGVLMMIGNNINYIKAYTEVNCLLEYLPQSYIDKLPKKLIELIQNQSNKQYNINIDTNKSLLEQNFSKKAKDLIVENMDKLHKCAELLLEKERINQEEFEALFD